MASPEPRSQYFRSQRLELHYASWGHDGAPGLVLVHGLRDHCRSWDAVARRLASKWHVVVPDLRGHGDSAWTSDGNYAMSGFVYDMMALLDHLGWDEAHFVGHSLGGNISMRFAAAYGECVKSLVMIEGVGPAPHLVAETEAKAPGQRLRTWMEARKRSLERDTSQFSTAEDAGERMRRANPRLSPDLARHLARYGTRPLEGGGVTWKYDPLLRDLVPEDFSQRQKERLWGGFVAPTLLIYGEESWASNPAEDGRLQHFSNARVLSFPGAAHWVHHDAVDGFVEAVAVFLDDAKVEAK